MRNNYEHTSTDKRSYKKEDKSTYNYHCENYQKCEELGSQSKYLYNKALDQKEKIETYSELAFQAECKAKELEKQVEEAWGEYDEFMEKARMAIAEGEEFMKASCRLLQESNDCYSNSYFEQKRCNGSR